jgi:thiol-disulfide isomerase/thioredoxin
MIASRLTRVGAVVLTTLLGVAVSVRAQDAPRALADLKREHEQASEVIQQRWERAKTPAERDAVQAEIWKEIKATAGRAFAWAEAHPDDPEAIDAIVWTIHGLANGNYPQYAAERARAFRLLTEKALASEKVMPLCYYADGASLLCPEELRFLEAALAKSPSRLVRGAACLGLARSDHGIADLARLTKDPIKRKPFELGWKGTDLVAKVESQNPEELDRRAEASYERLIKEFGDVKMPYPYNETPFAEMARGELYELRFLGVGKMAPDVEGEDVRGQKLRLSDYRGKVVAVVFWATWCGPCMGMVPHERELVKRLEGKPFVLLGINGDDDRAKTAEAMKKEAMTWPSLWNGGKLGGIVAKLGVRAWPTVYVIDAQGVIRYKNVRGEPLDQAVDRLVAEAEAAQK